MAQNPLLTPQEAIEQAIETGLTPYFGAAQVQAILDELVVAMDNETLTADQKNNITAHLTPFLNAKLDDTQKDTVKTNVSSEVMIVVNGGLVTEVAEGDLAATINDSAFNGRAIVEIADTPEQDTLNFYPVNITKALSVEAEIKTEKAKQAVIARLTENANFDPNNIPSYLLEIIETLS